MIEGIAWYLLCGTIVAGLCLWADAIIEPPMKSSQRPGFALLVLLVWPIMLCILGATVIGSVLTRLSDNSLESKENEE